MGPRLNLIATTVVTPDETFAGVQIVVRDDRATISTPKGASAIKTGVSTVVDDGPRARTVVFDDGTSWAVSLPERKPCGCS